jgi:hypothetical protein
MAPFKERMAELLLKSLELHGKRGRRDVQAARGPREPALIGGGPKIAQVMIVQERHVIILNRKGVPPALPGWQ